VEQLRGLPQDTRQEDEDFTTILPLMNMVIVHFRTFRPESCGRRRLDDDRDLFPAVQPLEAKIRSLPIQEVVVICHPLKV
jgi:hypothetical protein